MPTVALTTDQQCEDFAAGLAFLGTGGGGGTMADGVRLFSDALHRYGRIELTDIAELPANAWAVSVIDVGARKHREGPSAEELAKFGLVEEKYDQVGRIVRAVEELAAYAGVEVEAIIPAEIGSGNTSIPINAALRLGIPVVDGDWVGRAIPELDMAKPTIFGKSITPLVYVDRWGDVCIVKELASGAMADRTGRMLSAGAFGGLGSAGYLMQLSEANRMMVHRSLSTALAIGRAMREDREGGRLFTRLLQETGGWILFKGVLTGCDWESTIEFQHSYATHTLSGVNEFEGEAMKLWVKNEHHIAWRNGDVVATSPDLITLVDLETGFPRTNRDIAEGDRVAVVGMRIPDESFRTPRGLELLGPRHFGFDIDYVPIETRMAELASGGKA